MLVQCVDSQRKYSDALAAYRTSLKDVLGREREIRTVSRDREILVSRVLKLQKKRPTEEDPTWDIKMQDAQKELAACEACLRGELQALAGVKRRIFRDALSMRLRAFQNMGANIQAVAADAINQLASLGGETPLQTPTQSNFPPRASSPAHSPPYSVVSLPDSIAPSHSASQLSEDGFSSRPTSDDEEDWPRRQAQAAAARQGAPALSRENSGLSAGTARPVSPLLDRPSVGRKISSRAASPTPSGRPLSFNHTYPRAASPPPTSRAASPGPQVPGGYAIPSADAHRVRTDALQREEDLDSSDEEQERLKNVTYERHEGGGANRLVRKRHDSAPTAPAHRSGGGFFSGLAALFRGGKKTARDTDSLQEGRSSGKGLRAASNGQGWSTRADTNHRGPFTFRRSDSSDEDTRQFVKVVNTGNPQQRLALGDAGPKPQVIQPKRPGNVRRSSVLSDPGPTTALTDVTVGRNGTLKRRSAAPNGSAIPDAASANLSRASTIRSTTSTVKRKKKKRAPGSKALKPAGGDAPSIMSLVDEDQPAPTSGGPPGIPSLPSLANNAAETASLMSVGSDVVPSRAYGDEAPATHTPVGETSGFLSVPPSALKTISEGGSDSALSKRKSVRLAADTKINEAEYTNTPPPAAPATALKLTPPPPPTAWTSRQGSYADSSDEEGETGMSEYAKARKAMARADRRIKEAGSPEAVRKEKGKAKAIGQDE